ncbi:MAG TPA: N-acetylmuramic acid 6-phosphate etherase [Thermoplasmataceae archaeon]|nr:N-acetylmuramic acid 6-phosphate etherase [Thermoplasmataceae archaeon]
MLGTEDNDPLTRNINKLDTFQIARMIHISNLESLSALSSHLEEISKIIDVCVERIKRGGRVLYVGAGTSGRIGAQDVVELRPTFGMDKSIFDFVIAGGERALTESVEGAEDDENSAISALKEKNVCSSDTVIGITASGRTPFVISALKYASQLQCYTVIITNNHNSPGSRLVDVSIELLTGPEVIQGSTRLKAGTSQKVVLNMISTTVAIKLGFTYNNTMVRMQAWMNEKLRQRAVKMLVDAFGISPEEAQQTLKKYSYKVVDAFNHYRESVNPK